MPESVRRTKKSVPYFHMTKETTSNRQPRFEDGLFCFYLFFKLYKLFCKDTDDLYLAVTDCADSFL